MTICNERGFEINSLYVLIDDIDHKHYGAYTDEDAAFYQAIFWDKVTGHKIMVYRIMACEIHAK